MIVMIITHTRDICVSHHSHTKQRYVSAQVESSVYEVGRDHSPHIKATLVPCLNGGSLSHQPMVLPHNSQYSLPGLSAAKKPLKRGLFWLIVWRCSSSWWGKVVRVQSVLVGKGLKVQSVLVGKGLRVQSVLVGKACSRSNRSLLTWGEIRNQRKEDSIVFLPFLFALLVWDPGPWDALPTLRTDLLLQLICHTRGVPH